MVRKIVMKGPTRVDRKIMAECRQQCTEIADGEGERRTG
ncbi:MAG: hypothetical protein OJF47_002665 [Nitrospira sp.]|nr:MAG: hypothetical protein OJF47_002665 [Nitrospira sp.]